jgi:hypothetical protein
MDLILKERPWFKEVFKKPELQDIILKNLYEYYLTNNNIMKILPIITSNSNISIRVIDWFVTNYSKKNNIIYDLHNNDVSGDKYFNVFLQYKCQLKGYKKRLFDPFCRKQRIAFHYDENKCVVTTTGQLNFFKWAITYDVLKYVENNLEAITNDMINSNKIMIKKFNNTSQNNSSDTNRADNTKTNNSTESEKIRKKRHELSVSANKTINMHSYNTTITFESV